VPALGVFSEADQKSIVENVRLQLKVELYSQLKDQFAQEMEAFKAKFKQEQIERIKGSFQTDFTTILQQAKAQMQ